LTLGDVWCTSADHVDFGWCMVY